MNWRALFSGKKKDGDLTRFIYNAFGVKPRLTEMYRQALRHSSAAQKIKPGLKNSNERLEFLGDAILDSIVAHYLYNKYPLLPEGELTKMKSKVVRRENLNKIGYTLGVDTYLHRNLGKQEMHDSIVGNALEALIGALYLDKGYETTRDICLKILKEHGLDTRVHDDVDYKSKLHEWCQKYRKTLEFKVTEHVNSGGLNIYKMVLLIDGQTEGRGEGRSKKSAEQKAARQACQKIFGE